MTPTLVRQHLPHAGPAPRVDPGARARDWSEIQERMLVPLYEAVYERLETGPATRLLGLGCGSGLALLIAASKGAAVTGVEPSRAERLALARERLLPRPRDSGDRDPGPTRGPSGTPGTSSIPGTSSTPGIPGARGGSRTPSTRGGIRLVAGPPEAAADARTPPYTLITAFEPVGPLAGGDEGLVDMLRAAVPLAERGAPVVVTGWGPPERCATTTVLRRAGGPRDPDGPRAARRDDLEEIAARTGLRPDGSGRVACPFGYADLASARRGLLSTGLLDAAVAATDQERIDKELTEALHPYRREDGTVWMPNVFRYLVARVP
ncbi:SAM-dependent methyltransferase [Streptomyces sp. NPDC088789]|uniref:SAM-dependent methyltransferase n=1 Tax=Streptomyces sp. NPDC088789 TaxID=3365899 RepID=UPI003801E67A